MNKLIGHLITLIIMWVLTYLAFAFIEADLNSFNWPELSRVFLILIMVSEIPLPRLVLEQY